MDAGLYIHFPFCDSKCPYCHFYSVPQNDAGLRVWRAGLEKECLTLPAGVLFDTLYLGGGTPSLLDPDEVVRIRDLVLGRRCSEIAEFTFEANPGASGMGRFQGWREAGVTRLSVGVQSFDDGVLATLGRPYSAEEATRFCRAARESGYDSLAIDLMIGVPGETPEIVDRTVRSLLALEPDHVSAYFLENVEGLPFAEVLARRPVDEDASVDSYQRVKDALEAAGLRQYEISNFARPGKECRHNLRYWHYEPFIGLGPSACSHIGRARWTNLRSLESWADALERTGSARGEVVELSAVLAARESLIFGLRLVEGVDVEALERQTGVDVCSLYAREIDELASDGLLVEAGAKLWIPADKLLVSNAILSRFI